jgi:hypothetical protein
MRLCFAIWTIKRAERCKREIIGSLDESKLSADEYAVADALAVDRQRQMVRTHLGLHVTVLLWFAFFALFASVVLFVAVLANGGF